VDAAYNCIERLQGVFDNLTRLEELDVSYNKLGALEDFLGLKARSPKCVESLTWLDLRGNPLERSNGRCTRPSVIRALASLETLDGVTISAEERESTKLGNGGLSDELLARRGRLLERKGRLALMPLPQHEGAIQQRCEEDLEGHAVSGSLPLPLASIEQLDLRGLLLQSIDDLRALTNLVSANLSRNELTGIGGLASCVNLEELDLESNELSNASLRPLKELKKLKKLDLSHNYVTEVNPITCLKSLTQLSLESNLVNSLAGLNTLPRLMELYVGNNECSDLEEIAALQALTRLIILDTSGNPLCSKLPGSEYRLYMLFRLPQLKILDGIGVQIQEISQARFLFGGKLTAEAVGKAAKGAEISEVKALSLSRSKWRDISVMLSLDLSALRDLSLDHNQLSNFGILAQLPALSILRLSHNRIESLGPTSASTPKEPTIHSTHPPLQVLYLGNNRITDIAALCLHQMPALLALDLQSNALTHLDGLSNAPGLVELNLSHNKLR
ncbi:unnamed protein product, partial [Chrysoparadoxa australica]